MCGIICAVTSSQKPSVEFSIVKNNLKSRGPDFFAEKVISLDCTWNSYFAASILHTQGKFLTKQPIITSKQDILLWNGDVFGGDLISKKLEDVSDTQLVAAFLEKTDGNILNLLTIIEGPYSFIYYNQNQKLLWFGRDPLGRHSLLWKLSCKELLVLSVGHKKIPNLREIPASGIFCLHLDKSIPSLCLYKWSHWNECLFSCEIDFPIDFRICDEKIHNFHFRNLWNYSNHTFTSPNFFKTNSNSSDILNIMDDLLLNSSIGESVDQLLDLLIKSCEKRIKICKNICKNCTTEDLCSKKHAKVGILFSGGLDSTVIAYIANKFVSHEEPIDLLNVAFNRNGSFNVPDRNTAIMSFRELSSLCPNRIWNLVEINITEEELIETRENHICNLIYPLNTILDESLGCALWFACQGKGFVDNIPYTSTSKILLLGTGADEQLGGYVKHKNLLKRCNWHKLWEQLLKETMEISKRNLGRDDRIASDSGRQPRFPFLDEHLVAFIAKLPSWQRCDPISFPPGAGDKLLLRLAAVKLGLRQCAIFPKRAFQFGCRIAKSKEKGDKNSERL